MIPPDSSLILRRLSITVSGRVQGVGFRYHVEEAADVLGLTGWVMNGWDGRTVELEAQGDTEALESLLRKLKDGPPLAHVVSVTQRELPLREGEAGFEVRY